MNGIKDRLTYANVVATLALFAALAGGAYAAGLGRNTVGAKQIKTAGVKSQEVKNEALTGSDVKNDTLTGDDVREDSLGRVPDSSALEGLGAAAFLQDADIDFAAATNTATSPQTLLEFPGLDGSLTTDGDADNDASLRLVSTAAIGPDGPLNLSCDTINVTVNGPADTTVAPAGGLVGASCFVFRGTADQKPLYRVECAAIGVVMRCIMVQIPR